MKTEYFCLEPQSFKLDGGAMFGIIPKPLWSKVHPSDDQNRIELALRLILIKKEKQIILIDTGIGDYHGQKFDERFAVLGGPTPLEKSLALLNLLPSDITDLVISHLHFDHVGGIGKMVDGIMEPVLKNARIHLHKKHYEYSHHPTERDAGSFHSEYFMPIIQWYQNHNQLYFVDGNAGEIFPGLNFLTSMGHTPHLMHAYDDRFIYMADLIPTSNHVNIPWVMGYDIAPGITTLDKKHFLQFIAEKNLTMIFEHDPIYFGSTIKKNDKGDYVCDQKFAHQTLPAYGIF